MKVLFSFLVGLITWGIVYSSITFLIAVVFSLEWNEVKMFPLSVIFWGLFVSTPIAIFVAEDVYKKLDK